MNRHYAGRPQEALDLLLTPPRRYRGPLAGPGPGKPDGAALLCRRLLVSRRLRPDRLPGPMWPAFGPAPIDCTGRGSRPRPLRNSLNQDKRMCLPAGEHRKLFHSEEERSIHNCGLEGADLLFVQRGLTSLADLAEGREKE